MIPNWPFSTIIGDPIVLLAPGAGASVVGATAGPGRGRCVHVGSQLEKPEEMARPLFIPEGRGLQTCVRTNTGK